MERKPKDAPPKAPPETSVLIFADCETLGVNASTGLDPSGAGQPLPEPEGPGLNEENRQPTAPISPDRPAVQPIQPSMGRLCPNPECGKLIDALYVVSREDVSYTFYLEESTPCWDDENSKSAEQEFRCSECDFLLTDTESEAIAFLKDGTVPEGAAKRAASIAQEIPA